MKKSPKTPKAELPPDIVASDTVPPQFNRKTLRSYSELQGKGLPATLLFYQTASLGWVLTTLHISNASSRQRARGIEAERYYAIGVSDSKVYTVGRGPHVKKEISVYIKPSNIDRLRKYLNLYAKGMEDANQIRDRISSRRAQGALRRSGAGGLFGSWDS